MKAKAILFAGIGKVEIGSVLIPDPGPGEVLIKAEASCVSPGTELRCLTGRQDNMPAFPFIPGYTLTGRVIGRGPGATLKDGTLVFCAGTTQSDVNRLWGAHVSHAVKAEHDVIALPDGTDPVDASLAQLGAISYHGVRLGKPLPHETVAVIGLGPIGMLSARLHAASGARVVAADLSPERVALAKKSGIEAFAPRGSLRAAFAEVIPDGADIVVDSTGAPPVLADAAAIARDKAWGPEPVGGARLVIQGSYATDAKPCFPHRDVFMKELVTLMPRSENKVDYLAVIDLVRRGKVMLRDLAGTPHKPEDAPEVYRDLGASKGTMLTAVFTWS